MSDSGLPASAMADGSVEVVTGSRLHFGLLTDLEPDGLGRPSFGGVGVMIDQPGWSIRVSQRSESDLICVADPMTAALATREGTSSPEFQTADELASRTGTSGRALIERAQRVLGEYRKHNYVAPIELVIRRVVPSHLGFGSGTQFALAIGRAVDKLHGVNRSVAELAGCIGRGKRSAVGTWGFELGGLIVDGGKSTADSIGALVSRTAISDEWRFVLLNDSGKVGINGEHEANAFAKSPGMPQDLTDALWRIATTEIAPAFAERDHDAAARALDDYGNRVGRYFSEIQGGTFASADVARVVAQLRFDGVSGIAQTSWGPTCSVLCSNLSTATAIANRVNSIGGNITATIVQPLNSGARVEQFPFSATSA